MNRQLTATTQNPFIFQLDKKAPMRFVWTSLIFIYVLQYPYSQIFPHATPLPQYDWNTWLMAYSFLLISVALFMSALYIGLSGKLVKIDPTVRPHWNRPKRMGFPMVIMVFTLFGLWSYLMARLHIGMTIFISFDPLPFRIIGILFYGRLFVQPLVLSHIATGYANSKLKWFIYLMLFALGAWVSLTSGSRFAAILFALPLFVLFKGKSRWIFFGISSSIFIFIASIARESYLPFVIENVIDPIDIFGVDLLKTQDLSTERILLFPFIYISVRVMGIREVLMTLDFGDITPSFADSLQSFLAYFLPYLSPGTSVSTKNVYGFDDNAPGGFGLDLFSNFWVTFGGGSLVLYLVGTALMGWLLGKIYRLFAIGLERFGIKGLNMLVLVLLFLLVFENRGFLFWILFLMGWLFSRKETTRIVFVLLRTLSLWRILLPTQSPQSHPRI